jgi:hypothetical protein
MALSATQALWYRQQQERGGAGQDCGHHDVKNLLYRTKLWRQHLHPRSKRQLRICLDRLCRDRAVLVIGNESKSQLRLSPGLFSLSCGEVRMEMQIQGAHTHYGLFSSSPGHDTS